MMLTETWSPLGKRGPRQTSSEENIISAAFKSIYNIFLQVLHRNIKQLYKHQYQTSSFLYPLILSSIRILSILIKLKSLFVALIRGTLVRIEKIYKYLCSTVDEGY